jgi:hypothetical protein
MLRTIAIYCIIFAGLLALWASTSRDAMQFLYQHRSVNKWWGIYPEANGDLVSMSYLDFVSRFRHIDGPDIRNYPHADSSRIALYLDGDSYAWHLKAEYLDGVRDYHFLNRYDENHYHLDTSKTNILVIEIAERIFRPYFDSIRMFHDLFDPQKNPQAAAMLPRKEQMYAYLLPDIQLFNDNINQNLQFNLFNYQAVMPLFESKAALNYYVFRRASGRVVISDNGDFLFLKETVSRTGTSSSYDPLTGNEITTLVNNLNSIYDHYRTEGFAEVYLSVIPSAATIVQPKNYNGLIPSVQEVGDLKMKIIDVYGAFRNDPDLLYQPGDTHWNNTGFQVYLDLLNKTIKQHSVK